MGGQPTLPARLGPQKFLEKIVAPAHRQPVFGDASISLPISEAVAECILSIPVHAGLTEESLPLIVEAVLETAADQIR